MCYEGRLNELFQQPQEAEQPFADSYKKGNSVANIETVITDLLKSDSTSSASETRTLTRDLRKREQKEADKDQAKKR